MLLESRPAVVDKLKRRQYISVGRTAQSTPVDQPSSMVRYQFLHVEPVVVPYGVPPIESASSPLPASSTSCFPGFFVDQDRAIDARVTAFQKQYVFQEL